MKMNSNQGNAVTGSGRTQVHGLNQQTKGSILDSNVQSSASASTESSMGNLGKQSTFMGGSDGKLERNLADRKAKATLSNSDALLSSEGMLADKSWAVSSDRRLSSEGLLAGAGSSDRRLSSEGLLVGAGSSDRRLSSEGLLVGAGSSDRRLSSEGLLVGAGSSDRRLSSEGLLVGAGSSDRRLSSGFLADRSWAGNSDAVLFSDGISDRRAKANFGNSDAWTSSMGGNWVSSELNSDGRLSSRLRRSDGKLMRRFDGRLVSWVESVDGRLVETNNTISPQQLMEAWRFSINHFQGNADKINEIAGAVNLLTSVNEVSRVLLTAAIIHQTVTEKNVRLSTVEENFGSLVKDVISELTQDNSINRLTSVSHWSRSAKLVTLAEKLYRALRLERINANSSELDALRNEIRHIAAWSANNMSDSFKAAVSEYFETGTL